MKSSIYPIRLLFFLFIGLMSVTVVNSCKSDKGPRKITQRIQVPVYVKTAEFRSESIELEQPKKLIQPGKIYIYGNFLFINEINEGIHIVDNSNPYKPRFLNFLNIPGNYDIAVNNNILYADNYIDLLAFDISEPRNAKLIKRLENVFPTYFLDAAKTTFVAYKDSLVTRTVDEEGFFGGGFWLASDNSRSVSSFSGGGQSYGQGGSMARFTLMNSRLYTVSQSQLKLFDVSNAQNPTYIKNINLPWGIETIFPHENKLFIGSTTGMHIYDASDPSHPVRLSTYGHIFACDPVVVKDKYAYVTLRTGTSCRQGENVLEVVNIEDPTKPVMVSKFDMQNPHGLSISGSKLYICEGDFGLKVFNPSDVTKVGDRLLQHLKTIKATDVIEGPKSLIITGPQGIFQFNHSTTGSLKEISRLTI